MLAVRSRRRRRLSGLGLLAALTLAAGCSKPSAFSARNAVLLVVDGVGAGDLACGGDPDARTPGWDRLARRGAQFRAALSPSPREVPALASIFSGENPDRHGLREAGAATYHPDQPPLAEILRGVGSRTAGFPGPQAGAPGLARGYDRWEPIDGDLRPRMEAALAWLAEAPADEPYFLFVGGALDESPGGIAAVDRALSVFLRDLEATGRLSRTLIVATSGRAGSGPTGGPAGEHLRDAALRVPLVAWGPFPYRRGAVRSDPARLIDLHPTVLEALRVGAVQRFEGRALHERLEPWKTVETYAEAGPGEGEARSLRDGDWKLVRAGGEPDVVEELFDLADDPAERRNLLTERPDRTADLRARLDARPEPVVPPGAS